MYIRLSRYVRVYITESQITFIKKYEQRFPLLQTQFDVEDIATAQTLAAKGALVRKKLTDNTQYALNSNVRIVDDTKNNRAELVKQIEAYNLKTKLEALARNDEQYRPFRHLPKQFSKGILIGNIAIVPKKQDESRFIYVIADMVEARILYEDINLKQSAILIAHYLADGKSCTRHC